MTFVFTNWVYDFTEGMKHFRLLFCSAKAGLFYHVVPVEGDSIISYPVELIVPFLD